MLKNNAAPSTLWWKKEILPVVTSNKTSGSSLSNATQDIPQTFKEMKP